MKLNFRITYDNIGCSQILVDAVVNNNSPIQYAAKIEHYVSLFAEGVAKLYCIKANTPSLSRNEPEILGYERYTDKRYIEVVEELFWFEKENYDDCSLSDQDYINIANLKYPNEYDRCVTINSSLVLKYLEQEGTGKDFSYWTEFYKYCYKVVVHKDFNLDTSKEYSLDQLISLVEARDVLIVSCCLNQTHNSEDYKVAVTSCERLNELRPKEWLEHVRESDNPFHSEYMAYLKQFITNELIDEYLNTFHCACQSILAYPKDKCIMIVLKSYLCKDAETFKGMNISQKLEHVKRYEKTHDLINKARDIISNYSDAYRMYFA